MAERPSMREILEAARRGTSAPSKDDAAEPAAAPEPAADSGASKKPLTMAEKLAAARGLAPKPTEKAKEEAAAPVVPPSSAEVADTKDVADALRRAGARKDEEAAGRPAVEAPVGIRLPFAPSDRSDEPAAIGTPARSRVRVDHRGLLIFASWRVVGLAAATVAVVLTSWMMIHFLFPDGP